MRKIKVWDKAEKIMYPFEYVTSINFYENFVELGEEEHGEYTELLWDKSIDLDDCELIEYTDLKDKKGREIYEGDILKVTDEEDVINTLDSNTGIGVVEWLNKWGFWNVSRIENSLGDLKECYGVEVIGNIYDNPELLTQGQNHNPTK